MKQTISVIILILTFNLSCIGQSCLPEGIMFYSQEQIDNFQTNYPSCSEIEGDVFIISDSINNLNGLNTLNHIGGYLQIEGVGLTSLVGLDNLSTISGDFSIVNANLLKNLIGLSSLSYIGGYFRISGNDSLESFTGMNTLTQIENGFSISYNEQIEDLSGLSNIVSVGNVLSIYGNNSLNNLNGLNNLSTIEGIFQVAMNHSIQSLSGLDSLTLIDGDVKIWYNDSLSDISDLSNICADSIDDLRIYSNPLLCYCAIESICSYLDNPGGVVSIYINGLGCNNPSEIADHCNITLDCLPFGDYNFWTQSEIDSFPTNYPNCTYLHGDVSIVGVRDTITNLYGLQSVDSIENNFSIKFTNIGNFSGLNNLIDLGSFFSIQGCEHLKTLNGLDSLQWIGGLSIISNDSLLSLEGLENITEIGGMIRISSNQSILSLKGLENLTSVNGSLRILNNGNLVSITDLDNLVSIDGYIYINTNDNLTSLRGIDNIEYSTIEEIEISYNSMLSECDVNSICEFLILQGSPVYIRHNDLGCEDEDVVKQECTTMVEDPTNTEIVIYPNPTHNIVNIKTKDNYQTSELNIYNLIGQKILQIDNPQNRIQIGHLLNGLYIVELTIENTKYRVKLLKQ